MGRLRLPAGIGLGGEGIAELHVIHHRCEHSGLVPGQPLQPVGEQSVAEAARPRRVGVVLAERVFSEAVTWRVDGQWFHRLVVMIVLRVGGWMV